jgi:hypothetical protein
MAGTPPPQAHDEALIEPPTAAIDVGGGEAVPVFSDEAMNVRRADGAPRVLGAAARPAASIATTSAASLGQAGA